MDFLQYVDMESFLHRLDPRTKFLFFIAMSVLTSLIKNGLSLVFLFIFFLIIWTISKTGIYMLIVLKKIKVLLLFVFFLWLILGIFENNPGASLWSSNISLFGNNIHVSFQWYDIYKGSVLALRIFLMISSFYTVIISTNFSEIILGLQKFKIPYSISFGIGLIFQIIPMIVQEFYAIMEAQSSRGLEVEKCNVIDKMKNYISLSLPLLFRVLSKGHAISLAMYYYKLDFKIKRTSYKTIKASYRDAIFLSLTTLSIIVTVALNFLFYYPI